MKSRMVTVIAMVGALALWGCGEDAASGEWETFRQGAGRMYCNHMNDHDVFLLSFSEPVELRYNTHEPGQVPDYGGWREPYVQPVLENEVVRDGGSCLSFQFDPPNTDWELFVWLDDER